MLKGAVRSRSQLPLFLFVCFNTPTVDVEPKNVFNVVLLTVLRHFERIVSIVKESLYLQCRVLRRV